MDVARGRWDCAVAAIPDSGEVLSVDCAGVRVKIEPPCSPGLLASRPRIPPAPDTPSRFDAPPYLEFDSPSEGWPSESRRAGFGLRIAIDACREGVVGSVGTGGAAPAESAASKGL